MNLLDNYEMSTGVAETVTSEELEENNIFLNAILQTQVMKVHFQEFMCKWCLAYW